MPSNKIKILCIEDSKSFIRFLEKIFDPIGKQIDFHSSIKSAKPSLLFNKYDLIILDLNINDSYGLNTLLKVKSYNKHNSPILILTSNRNLSLLQNCLDNGAEDVIIKPIDQIHNFLTKVFLLVNLDKESKNKLRESHKIPEDVWDKILTHL